MSTPETSPFLPFARPSITDREKQAVLEVLDSGWLTTGPRTKLFEQRFAERVGARYAIALNSATAALHLALEALGVGPGDEVIVPTWTFAASGEVVVYRGARPVLVDVDPRTLNATPENILAAVTTRTRAVIPVHIAGLPVEIAAARRTARAPRRRDRRGRSALVSQLDRRAGRPSRRHIRAGGSFFVLRHQDPYDRRRRDARHRRSGDRGAGPDHVIPRDQQRCVELVRSQRIVVLRDRGRRLQIQHD